MLEGSGWQEDCAAIFECSAGCKLVMKNKAREHIAHRHHRDAVSEHLERLGDTTNPSRRQAAVALGKLGDSRAVAPMVELLRSETDASIRASLILALGAIGGEAVAERLGEITPQSPKEADALAKARDRILSIPLAFEWRPQLALDDLRIEVVEGLERPVSRMLLKEGFPETTVERPGLLRFSAPVAAERVTPPPRYAYGVRLLISEAKATDDLEAVADALLTTAGERPYWNTHCPRPDGTPARYRFGIEGRNLQRDLHQKLLRKIRTSLEPLGAIDSPSHYMFEIILNFSDDKARLYFRPSTFKDPRFAYRLRDVAASMNPVVAATLSRLIPVPLPGAIIDPTCGSGTLLFERGFLSPDSPLIGIDVSPEALQSAQQNAVASEVAGRTELRNANARDSKAWSACSVVIANLPFGLRSGRDDPDLEGTYRAILANAAKTLSGNGRVLMASANRGLFERAITGDAAFRVLAKYRLQSGGLFVHIAILGRKEDRPSS